jgi:hypothetical protein
MGQPEIADCTIYRWVAAEHAGEGGREECTVDTRTSAALAPGTSSVSRGGSLQPSLFLLE